MRRKYDIGFLGGGQLARMSIMAAQRMGLRCISLDPSEDTPASQVAPYDDAPLHDIHDLTGFMLMCERITLENEFVAGESIARAIDISGLDPHHVLPSPAVLSRIQDKLTQRSCFDQAGVPSPRAIELSRDGEAAISEIGFPMVLKARFGGYDGKGTRFARNRQEFEGHRSLWGSGGWLAETWIEFRREIACMVFVSADGGESGSFPTVETVQKDGVCDLVLPLEHNLRAEQVAMAAVEAVGGRGLFGVEMFETEDGEILVNEIAPRPHNSGHYTLDWGGVSQFEQHIRLVMGFPVGRADGEPVVMANLFGQADAGDFRLGVKEAMEGDPGVRVHWYGKAESRPGRKMGHINVVGGENLKERAIAARDRFYLAMKS